MSELLTTQETSKLLGVSNNTLTDWRYSKRYDLPYVKVGSRVMYEKKDVESFISQNKVGGENAANT